MNKVSNTQADSEALKCLEFDADQSALWASCNIQLRNLENIQGIQELDEKLRLLHMIAQSRSEIERRFGRLETLTIEENAVVKQWFGFSSFEEAERVSKAMGESQIVSHGMGVSSDKMDISGNFSVGKERMFPPERLMSLPADEQIIHVKDIGFIHCKKIRQNEIAPYCHELADNPLEGGRLPPDPKITLPTK